MDVRRFTDRIPAAGWIALAAVAAAAVVAVGPGLRGGPVGDSAPAPRAQVDEPAPEAGAPEEPCYYLLPVVPDLPGDDRDARDDGEIPPACHRAEGPSLLPPAGQEQPRIADVPLVPEPGRSPP